MTIVPGRPDLATVAVGDVVRVGKGKKLWRVDGFWGADFRPMADLAPLDGYSRSSAELERLTLVDRPVDTRAPGTEETCS